MANLDELELRVGQLNPLTSSSFSFKDALRGITEAAADAGTDADSVQQLLISFRGKIPNRPSYDRMRADVKDLIDAMTISVVAARIARIKARNDALANLTSELNEQSKKAKSDAALLTRIKEAVDKATKTVEEVKALVDELQATDANTKSRLKALIETLGDISSIFKKQEA